MSAIKKTNSKKSTKGKVIQLQIFRGSEIYPADKLINGVLHVAQSSLWFNKEFTTKEKEVFRQLIADHFNGKKSQNSTFKEIIERICLAKRYVSRKRGRYISKPQDWFNIHFPLGLAGTGAWLERVKEVRSDVPEYNKGIKILANGILRYIEKPTEQTFHCYRRQLIKERQFDLLQILNNTIINLKYNN